MYSKKVRARNRQRMILIGPLQAADDTEEPDERENERLKPGRAA
jgi:hypothetical protein